MSWFVYLLRCEDGSLYAGITTDPERRLKEHTAGRGSGGARYTALKKPVGFAALWEAPDRPAASKLEYRLKKLSHGKKQRLADGEELPDLPDGVKRT
ncbi:MAG: GIY-YIG nuclease family protein [Oscillospiraceae bacterium]|nr:GIY-YIG nuclease family protein [Oscillospiraceae bacterium]